MRLLCVIAALVFFALSVPVGSASASVRSSERVAEQVDAPPIARSVINVRVAQISQQVLTVILQRPFAAAVNLYQGFGDIQTANVSVYYSAGSCFSAAYSGNVIDAVDVTGNTTGTRLQCSGGVISALVSGSACTFVTGNACSPLATTCLVSCKVVTAYDQSGAGLCSGACDLTQATNATRPTLNVAGQNGLNTMTFSGAQNLNRSSGISSSTAQPQTVSAVAKRTSVVSNDAILEANSGNFGTFFSSSSGSIALFAGSTKSYNCGSSCTESAYHAIQFLFNGTSSVVSVDGSTSTTGASGASTPTGNLAIGATSAGAAPLTGILAEVAVVHADITSNFAAINTNQHSRWGF